MPSLYIFIFLFIQNSFIFCFYNEDDLYLNNTLYKNDYFFAFPALYQASAHRLYHAPAHESYHFSTDELYQTNPYYSLSLDISALYRWGCLYYKGLGVEKNIKTAIGYFQIAANQGCIKSQRYLMEIYFSAIDMPQNIAKTLYYAEQLAMHNDAKAQFILGLIYYKETLYKNDQKAIYFFQKAAFNNYLPALGMLSIFYYYGKAGLTQDFTYAFKWAQKAAFLNYPPAYYMLFFLYYHGQGTYEDKKTAYDYLKQALYYNLAYTWEAFFTLYLNKNFHDIDFLKWCKMVAARNNANALYALGYIYYQGITVREDIELAVFFFQKAALQHHALARFVLKKIYFESF